jgi:hypothetical protein
MLFSQPEEIVMNRYRQQSASVLVLVCAALLVASNGCSTISVFDQYAYTQTTSLKVDALALMGKATKEAAAHNEAIEQLTIKIDKAYEYEKGRPKNEITTRMWDVLKSPERNLLGGFVKRWREKGKLSQAFIEESKELVAEAFDLISSLESQKIKPDDAAAKSAKFFQ